MPPQAIESDGVKTTPNGPQAGQPTKKKSFFQNIVSKVQNKKIKPETTELTVQDLTVLNTEPNPGTVSRFRFHDMAHGNTMSHFEEMEHRRHISSMYTMNDTYESDDMGSDSAVDDY